MNNQVSRNRVGQEEQQTEVSTLGYASVPVCVCVCVCGCRWMERVLSKDVTLGGNLTAMGGERKRHRYWKKIWGLDSSHQPTNITMKSKWVKHDLQPQHAQTEDFTWWLSLSFDVYFGLWYSLLLPLTWINSPEERNTNLFVYPSLSYPCSFSTHLPMFGTVLLGEFQNFLFG